MKSDRIYRGIRAAAVFAAGWLGIRYLLPALVPFGLGALVAVAAEPLVGACVRRTGLPRPLAAGLGVSAMLILLLGLASLIGALAVKELGNLAAALPDAQQTLEDGMGVLRDAAVRVTQRLPEGVRTAAGETVTELFSGSTAMTRQVTQRLRQWLNALLGWLPEGALGLGTGILAGYMISARLPQLRQSLQNRLPKAWYERYLPALRRSRGIIGGWLKAQGKLAGATWLLLTAGFTLLGIPYGILWAVPIAVVDAIPVLGTGVVLVPWALVCFLRDKTFQGIGLLALTVAAMIMRRVLEPKMVGKQLDLDPLATLLLLYLGYRFWGIGGMILAPLLAAAAKGVLKAQTGEPDSQG